MGQNLKEWRSKRVKDETLPSDLAVKLRRVSVLDLLVRGRVPVTLSTLVEKAAGKKISLSEFNEFAELINLIVDAALVYPPIAKNGAEPDDDHLTWDDLDYADRLFIFNWANEEAEQLSPFRSKQAIGVGDLPVSLDFPPTTEQPDPSQG